MSNNLDAVKRAVRRHKLRTRLEEEVKTFLEVRGTPKEEKTVARLAKVLSNLLLAKGTPNVRKSD